MWWSIAVGLIILLALGVIALWGMRGSQFKLPLLRGKNAQTPPPNERKEPVFAAAQDSQQELDLNFTPPQLPQLEDRWQAVYCYVIDFFQEQVQDPSCFDILQKQLRQRHISVFQLLGFNENNQQWELAQTPSSYRFWKMMVPLADRSGDLSRERIKLIQDDCRRFCEKMHQRGRFPPLEGALERAKLLDDFCNEVDMVLKLRLVLGEPLPPPDVEELLLRSYLNAEDGCYVYRLDSEKLFTATPLMLPNNQVREIMFLLDAPRVSQPQRAFEDMIKSMQEIADLKKGKLYGRKETHLTDTDIGLIRGGIDRLAVQMTEKGVSPGSTLAHLLFS